jgi:sulfide:quinone oxidoreductase
MRAAIWWALAEADRSDPATIIGRARAAEYDMAELKPALKRRAEGAGT